MIRAAQPSQSYAPVLKGRPSSADKKRGRQMMYRTKVRRRLVKPMAGEPIRDARIALLAASWRGHERRKAAFAQLNGTYLQHTIREEGAYVDLGDDVNGDFELDQAEDDDIEMKEDIKGRDRQLWLWKRKALTAIRQLDVAHSVNEQVLRGVAERFAQFAVALRSESSSRMDAKTELPGAPNTEQWMSEGARRTALYRAYGIYWVRRVADSDGDSGYSNSNKCDKTPGLVRQRFSNDGRLAELSRRQGALQSLGAQWTDVLLHKTREGEVRTLLKAMVVSDEAMARRLVDGLGSARRIVRLPTNSLGKREMRAIHGPLDAFATVADQTPLIARLLRDAFGSLHAAQAASFAEFIALGSCDDESVNGGNGAESKCDALYSTVDERLSAFCVVAKSKQWRDANARISFDAEWRLFQQVCKATRAPNCELVTTALLDANATGASKLARLACEPIPQICSRCPILNSDEAVMLKRFAQGFVESPVHASDDGGCLEE